MSQGIYYTMGLNPANFLSGMAKAKGEVGSMQGKVGGLTGAVGKLTGALAALGAGAAAFGMVKKGLTLAADFEKTEVGMNTIIKKMEVTRGLIGKLQALARSTPLEMSELTGGARQMLGAGWKLGDIVRDLRMFGDVAAGAQTDVGGLVTVISQVKGKGKLLAEELQQFAERGVAGLREALAAVRGTSTGKLAKDMEAGKVSLQNLMAAMQQMTAKGGIFFNAMSDQAKTTYGMLATLRDAVDQIYLAWARPLNESLKPMLQGAIELADTLAAKARNVVGSWALAWNKGKLGQVIWEQLKWGLEMGANYGVAVFSGMGFALGHVLNEALKILSDEELWKAGANILNAGLLGAAATFKLAMISAIETLTDAMPDLMKALGLAPDKDLLEGEKKIARGEQTLAGKQMARSMGRAAALLDKAAPKLVDAMVAAPHMFQRGMALAPKPFEAKQGALSKEFENDEKRIRANQVFKDQKAFDARANPKKASPLDFLNKPGERRPLDAFKSLNAPGSPLDRFKGAGVRGAIGTGSGYGRSLSLRERELGMNAAGSRTVARVRSRREKESNAETQIVNNTKKAADELAEIKKQLNKT